MFFIPDDHLSKFFISVDSQGYLQSLVISDVADDGTINSPIFTPSRGRHDIGESGHQLLVTMTTVTCYHDNC